MDITFHYFAIKALARAAGYEEEKAQRIATYSQFVDDFNYYAYMRCGNIPSYLYDSKLDIVVSKFLNEINPVTTGFYDVFDMASLVLPRPQKFTVSPFHFIPMDKRRLDSGKRWAVPATLRDGSYISTLLEELKTEILSRENGATDDDLMHMGMLFHTFADTYAHQLFSGYADKRNAVVIKHVYDEITGNDVTEQYLEWIEKWTKKLKDKGISIPGIGHMLIMHIPDLTHLRFEMEYTENGETYTHARSNTMEFLDAAECLYELLCECLPNAEHMEWCELSGMLANAFLFDASKELNEGETAAVQKLTPHWAEIFEDYRFSYSSENVKDGFLIDRRAVLVRDGKEVSSVVINNPDDAVAKLLKDANGIHKEELKTALEVTINKVGVCRDNLASVQEDSGMDMHIDGVGDIFISHNYTDDFYKFNYFAELLLIRLYGDNPRK